MKILVDMNLSPDWVQTFVENNFEAIRWSNVGDPHADDSTLM